MGYCSGEAVTIRANGAALDLAALVLSITFRTVCSMR
jgi:hypothetical protein